MRLYICYLFPQSIVFALYHKTTQIAIDLSNKNFIFEFKFKYKLLPVWGQEEKDKMRDRERAN